MQWEAYIQAMSEHTGITIDFSSETGTAFDVGNRRFLLLWNAEKESFLFYKEIMPTPSYLGSELARELLSANFLLGESLGTTLSYDKSENMVGINQEVGIANLSPQDFLVRLNEFFAVAETWEGRVSFLQKQIQNRSTSESQVRQTDSVFDTNNAYLKV